MVYLIVFSILEVLRRQIAMLVRKIMHTRSRSGCCFSQNPNLLNYLAQLLPMEKGSTRRFLHTGMLS